MLQNDRYKNKRRSVEFSFSLIGVWGYPRKPGGDDSDWKFVPISSKEKISGNFKGIILAYDKLCGQKVKRNMYMRPPKSILSI